MVAQPLQPTSDADTSVTTAAADTSLHTLSAKTLGKLASTVIAQEEKDNHVPSAEELLKEYKAVIEQKQTPSPELRSKLATAAAKQAFEKLDGTVFAQLPDDISGRSMKQHILLEMIPHINKPQEVPAKPQEADAKPQLTVDVNSSINQGLTADKPVATGMAIGGTSEQPST